MTEHKRMSSIDRAYERMCLAFGGPEVIVIDGSLELTSVAFRDAIGATGMQLVVLPDEACWLPREDER